MNSGEKQLWLEYQKGDPDALFKIYEILFPQLLRIGAGVVNDRDYVHGCIDQFFLYLWDKRTNLSMPENLSSYLLVSFKRYLVQDLKRQNPTWAAIPDGQESEPSVEDLLIEGQSLVELQLKIGRAMQKLSPRQRELIRLRYYQGLSCDQIAKRTVLSHRTIYNKLHEAIKVLRKEIVLLVLILPVACFFELTG
ncbi:MAG TPA: sigma-70 family RNA polymerase sigma factor, partial [Sphingobacteriaceae bacterium]